MSSTSSRIRQLLESLAAPDKTNRQSAFPLSRFYGTRLFKCKKLACEQFSLGFETMQERDQHMRTYHDRPFKCSNPLCDMSRLGFLTRQSLKSHEDKCLPDSPPDPPPKQQHPAGTFTITPNMDDSSRWSMLKDAVHAGDQDMVAELFNLGVYRSQKSSKEQSDLLEAAIKSRSTTIVDFILDQDESINLDAFIFTGWGRVTPLQFAVDRGVEKVTKRLLERGAGVDVRMEPGEMKWITTALKTPLIIACEKGSEPLVRLLLEFNPDTSKEYDYKTPFMWAAFNGHETIVEILLAKYPELALQKNKSGDTALRYAAEKAQYRVVELLLKLGVDVNHDVPLRHVGLSCKKASTQQIEETIRILISNGAEIRPTNTNLLSRYIYNGAVSTIKLLLEAGVDVEGRARNGETPLYSACLQGKKATITMLIQAGADPDINGIRKLASYKKWAEKNPNLDPPVKSSTPKGGRVVTAAREGEENTPSSTPT
ncbi:ankyrin repeat-containing domain protein [Trichophaea hybrida]|nr:ankyrin repeat-containing domain protein [Trichophaea hybrida]